MLNLFKTTKSFDELSSGDFAEKIRGNESGLIDVRTPAEYKGGHLPGSQNIDLTSADFLKRIEKIKKSDTVFWIAEAVREVQRRQVFQLSGDLPPFHT